MHVFDFSPMKLSLNTWVSLLALKGKCVPLRLNARIHSFKANKDLLISAPSIPKNFNKSINYFRKFRSKFRLLIITNKSILVVVYNWTFTLTSLSISGGRISTPFITSKIDERKLSVHFVCTRHTRYYLEYRVRSRRIGISARLTARSGAISMLY